MDEKPLKPKGRGPSIKAQQKEAWRAEYIKGVEDGKWVSPIQYWTRALRPLGGISKPSFWKISSAGAWASAGRMVLAQTRHADVVDEQTRKRMKLIEAYQQTGDLATSVLRRVRLAMKRGTDLDPGDLKRLSETIAKSHETLSLALDRPTSINGGIPQVSIQYFRESAPYQLGDGISVPVTVDGESHGLQGEASGGERGEADKKDRPVLEVGIGKDPDESVQGGGVVSLPVLPSGEDGSVAEIDRYVGEPAHQTDNGKAE